MTNIFPTDYSDKATPVSWDKLFGYDSVWIANVNITVWSLATASFTASDTDDLSEWSTNKYASTTNVNAAWATMNADTTMVGNSYFLDEDTLSSDDATKVASQQSIKAYVDNKWIDINWLTEESWITDGDELVYYNGASNVKVDFTDLSSAIGTTVNEISILQTTRLFSWGTWTVNVAHGMSSTPSYIEIHAKARASDSTSSDTSISSDWFADWTDDMCSYFYLLDSGSSIGKLANNSATKSIFMVNGTSTWDETQNADITFDGTNIIFSWTRATTGSDPASWATIYITMIAHA